MLGIPVVHVLGVDALLLRLEGGQYVRTVEPHGVVVKGIVLAKLSKQSGGSGPIGTKLQRGREIRTGLHKMIYKSIIIGSLNAQILGVGQGYLDPGGVNALILVPVFAFPDNAIGIDNDILVLAFLFALLNRLCQQSRSIAEPLRCIDDPAVHQVAVRAIHSGVADVTGSCHIVVSGHGILLVAVRIIPILAGTEVESPLLAVGLFGSPLADKLKLAIVVKLLDGGNDKGNSLVLRFPGLGSAGNDVAIRIVLNKGVYGVSADYQLVGGAADQVVHGGHFAGIQGAINLLVSELTTVGADVGLGLNRLGSGSVSRLIAISGLLRIGRLIRVYRSVALATSEACYYHCDSKQHSKHFLHCFLSFCFFNPRRSAGNLVINLRNYR